MSVIDPTAFADHVAIQCERYSAALAVAEYDYVTIAAGRPKTVFLDDNDYPFRVNPHFNAWVPLTGSPESFIVFRPGHRPVLIHYSADDYWHAPPAAPDPLLGEHFEVHTVTAAEQIAPLITQRGRGVFLGEWEQQYEDWSLGDPNPPAVLNYLHYHRACKTAYELDCMREAARRGARAHLAAERLFREGGSEYDIHLAYLAACRHVEAELPYGNIIALNEHAAILHYQNLDRDAPTGDDRHSFLIDAGASCNGYASDITRTYAARDGLFADLVTAMEAAQLAMCEEVGPGVSFIDLHLGAHEKIAAILHASGIVKLPAEDIVATGVSSYFFPHGLGHYLGLQVHDAGGRMAGPDGGEIARPEGHPYLRLTRTLQEGHVTTIEPGLYFIAKLLDELASGPHAAAVDWDRVATLRPCGGIRIEDDVLVTAQGHDNLTRTAFHEIA